MPNLLVDGRKDAAEDLNTAERGLCCNSGEEGYLCTGYMYTNLHLYKALQAGPRLPMDPPPGEALPVGHLKSRERNRLLPGPDVVLGALKVKTLPMKQNVFK